MFLHMSVILSTGGRGSLYGVASYLAVLSHVHWGGGGRVSVSVPIFLPGVSVQGVSVQGGLCPEGSLFRGLSVKGDLYPEDPPDRDPPPPPTYGEERAVRILRECILDSNYFLTIHVQCKLICMYIDSQLTYV